MMKPKVSYLLHSHAEPYKSASLLVETRLRKEYRLQSQDLQVKCNYFAGSWINALNPGGQTPGPLTIIFQESCFFHELPRFIKNTEYTVKDGSTQKLEFKASLSMCGLSSADNEAGYVRPAEGS